MKCSAICFSILQYMTYRLGECVGITQQCQSNYAKGVPTQIALPEKTLPYFLDQSVKYYPNNIATDFLGKQLTYSQLHEQVGRATTVLRAAGIRRGDRVAVILPNCPQHIIAIYAILRLGAIVTEHNPLAPTSEIQSQLQRCAPKVVIAWEKSIDKVIAGFERKRKVFSVNLTASLPLTSRLLLSLPIAKAKAQRNLMRSKVPSGIPNWDSMVSQARQMTTFPDNIDPNSTAVLLHTGGTTGEPKSVMLSHANLIANSEQSASWVCDLHEGAETFYSVLPFFHAFGLTLCCFAAIRMSATQVIFPKFDENLVLDALNRVPCTFLPGVPPMFSRITKSAKARGITRLPSIRYAVSGAMSLSGTIAEEWEKLTGGYIIEGYGMTECSPIVLGNPLSKDRRPGTLGLPYPSTEIKIVDPEDISVEVADGEIGELLVRGPQVFQGYYNNPEETANVLQDGWLRTGDLVRVDNGFIVMADRRKELIISGGFNIYPSQVEAAVKTMPGIEDVAVVGIPEDESGESVVAAIVLKKGANVDLESVRKWAEKSLAHYALPRQIAILSELPYSHIGKILRKKVRAELLNASEQASEQISSMRDSVRESISGATNTTVKQIRSITSHISHKDKPNSDTNNQPDTKNN